CLSVRGGGPGRVSGSGRRSGVRGPGDVRVRGRRGALQRNLALAGELGRQLEVGRYVEEVAVVRVRGRGGGCGGGQDRARQGTARGRYDSRRPGLCRGGYGALDEGRPTRLVTELLDIVRRHRRPSIASARPPGCSTTKLVEDLQAVRARRMGCGRPSAWPVPRLPRSARRGGVGTRPRPGAPLGHRAGEGRGSGLDRLTLAGALADGGGARGVRHLDPARPGLLADRDRQRQDAVGVRRRDLVEGEPTPQGELAGERARGTFPDQPLRVVTRALRALRA